MRTLLSAAGAALLAWSGATAASAQNNDGRGFRLGPAEQDWRALTPDKSAQLILANVAECVTAKRRTESEALLRTVAASEQETALYEKLSPAMSACMPEIDWSTVGNERRARGQVTLSFPVGQLRGALAESLLRRERAALSADKLALGEEAIVIGERFQGARSAQLERVFALGFAGCVMAQNAGQLQSLFRTEPGSKAERAAIVAMAPSFSGCVMEGQRLAVDPATLRNQLAEVTYYALHIETPDA